MGAEGREKGIPSGLNSTHRDRNESNVCKEQIHRLPSFSLSLGAFLLGKEETRAVSSYLAQVPVGRGGRGDVHNRSPRKLQSHQVGPGREGKEEQAALGGQPGHTGSGQRAHLWGSTLILLPTGAGQP